MAGGVLTDLCLGLTESVFNGFVQIKGKGGEVSSWEMFQQHSFLSAWIFFLFLVVSFFFVEAVTSHSLFGFEDSVCCSSQMYS